MRPIKIAVDVSTTIVSTYLLVQQELALALAVLWVPSIAVTIVLIRLGDFSRIRASRIGEYLRRYMTPGMQALRLGGEGIIAVAAWCHGWLLIPVGIAVPHDHAVGDEVMRRQPKRTALRTVERPPCTQMQRLPVHHASPRRHARPVIDR
ncbi:MAG TPA: hypothetical protein VK550_10990 [Polyangiaceae bacterium]|nr:hypothetical protein [Polyangiaceae bacterium]